MCGTLYGSLHMSCVPETHRVQAYYLRHIMWSRYCCCGCFQLQERKLQESEDGKARHYLTVSSYRIEHRMVRQLCRPFVANRSLAVSRFHFSNNWNNFEILYSVWKWTACRLDGWESIFEGGNFFFQILHRIIILVRVTPSPSFTSCLCSWKMGVN